MYLGLFGSVYSAKVAKVLEEIKRMASRLARSMKTYRLQKIQDKWFLMERSKGYWFAVADFRENKTLAKKCMELLNRR